ncbi:AAA family ATPase [Marinobacter halotolerans]|uniref:AAA family ATPase n=1 Tax=Marinobacter halotolerans TaxID=1569211 RepID=UPI001246C069|nr:AAA family ATPase [Marinobacter halotolerans]
MPDELIPCEETIRVTAVPFRRSFSTVIRGVPVRDDHLLKSATYFVSVIAPSAYLPVDPTPGQLWRVRGHKTVNVLDHGAYETNEHAYKNPDAFDFQMPETGESFITFISKDKTFAGIGESKARQLWNRFGADIHRILADGSGTDLRGLQEILSEQSIKALFAGYDKYKNLRHTVWMSQAKIPHAVQQRILKHHQLGTVDAIRKNPFELVHFGLSFKEVDKILNAIHGHAWEHKRYPEERIQAAVVQALKDCMSDGSTWLKVNQVRNRVFNYLKNEALGEKGIQWLKNAPGVALYHDADDRLHPTATAIQELAVAKRINHLSAIRTPLSEANEAIVDDVLRQLPYELAEKQKLAIMTSLSEGVSCITGGAGTGKTTVLSTFLKAAEQMGYGINAVALSGRAAMRLHESIGYLTMTIARFLREEPVACPEGSKALLVIDEASMIDLPTMFRIINHVDPAVKIVLTGDPSQLPPIGVGKVLHDLVLSDRVQNTTLDIVKRQKGSTGIPQYSKLVNAGEVPASLSAGSIHFHEVADTDLALKKAIDLYLIKPAESRIIAPTRKLVGEANELIQDNVNGDSPLMNFNLEGEDYFLKLRLHDQILFTQNHPNSGVQNGSLGKLISVDQDEDIVGVVKLDTGATVDIAGDLLDAIELGYAMTLHKAQGSQFSRVIVLLKEVKILDRSWLYTALTRAETEVHIIGTSELFKKVTEAPPKAFRRKTMLTRLIDHLPELKPNGGSILYS